jgi:hypothetical protein
MLSSSFFSILWCSQVGNHQQKDLDKFCYKKKLKNWKKNLDTYWNLIEILWFKALKSDELGQSLWQSLLYVLKAYITSKKTQKFTHKNIGTKDT